MRQRMTDAGVFQLVLDDRHLFGEIMELVLPQADALLVAAPRVLLTAHGGASLSDVLNEARDAMLSQFEELFGEAWGLETEAGVEVEKEPPATLGADETIQFRSGLDALRVQDDPSFDPAKVVEERPDGTVIRWRPELDGLRAEQTFEGPDTTRGPWDGRERMLYHRLPMTAELRSYLRAREGLGIDCWEGSHDPFHPALLQGDRFLLWSDSISGVAWARLFPEEIAALARQDLYLSTSLEPEDREPAVAEALRAALGSDAG